MAVTAVFPLYPAAPVQEIVAANLAEEGYLGVEQDYSVAALAGSKVGAWSESAVVVAEVEISLHQVEVGTLDIGRTCMAGRDWVHHLRVLEESDAMPVPRCQSCLEWARRSAVDVETSCRELLSRIPANHGTLHLINRRSREAQSHNPVSSVSLVAQSPPASSQ